MRTVLCLAAIYLTMAQTAAMQPEKAPKPLPAEVVDAWKKTGAEVGWIFPSTFGYLHFRASDTGEAGEIPAFRFVRAPAGVLGKLPAPEREFGLILSRMPITKATRNDLLAFKNLSTLEFYETLVSAEELAPLAALPSLRSLSLFHAVTGSALKALPAFKKLRSLYISSDGISNADVKHLAALEDLEVLTLADTGITEAGLQHLAGLKKLREVSLWYAQFGDPGMKLIAGWPALEALEIYHTRITDAGLKELAALPKLERLQLGCTRISDAGLKELAALKALTWLDLSETRITDAGMKELAGVPTLRRLDLRQTRVADAGLKDLAGLKNLNALDLRKAKATREGIADLKKAMPQLLDVRGP